MFTRVRGNHNFDCIKITACVPSSSCFGRNYFHVNALHTNLPMSYIAHLLEEEIFVICVILIGNILQAATGREVVFYRVFVNLLASKCKTSQCIC